MDRASEALAGGDLEAARNALERAVELRPRDAQALGLLGQACYRQGGFDDAAAAWKRLVDDNPVEPGARVNLGLALLKGKRHAEARRQLEIAVDLDPGHRRAMNYLGLALLESGSPVDAREWFRKAGSEQMVARCDEAIAAGWQVPELPVAVAAALPADRPQADAPSPSEGPAPVAAAPAAAASGLREWVESRRLSAPEAGPFGVRDGVVSVAVRGELRARLDGLFAVRGRVALVGELKRFRGRAIDRAFGEGAARMHRASGEGELFLHAGRRRFTVV
ncbi:MAG TPA: tetratricopeptide repeat protein, partial [Anaeromyxobacteraceae bacterium]|nr:tetratricopeptide repeat protein [Anaeromyxobacteraceae bacterium]